MIELLADNNFGDTRPNALAGPTGLVIILLLVAATIFLIRNMNKRLKRLPESFPNQQVPAMRTEADAPEKTDGDHRPEREDGAEPGA
ncbi:hypothetical protein [Phytomonospora endophytica]|uniref:Uncharacterized protein n=1 Tax=Phytomonospora endophytica TaxID=714109 RepID=A0A841FKU5_9ACTN|nr:hypothetical protein [Phytomonospora endophytica]